MFYHSQCPPNTTIGEELDVAPLKDGSTRGAHEGRAWAPPPCRSAKPEILDSGSQIRRAPNPGGGHFGGGTVVESVGIDRAQSSGIRSICARRCEHSAERDNPVCGERTILVQGTLPRGDREAGV
ncbi:hypothetical protein IscW_ISCW022821 [Ixodes scapularis]|uniref:Uncharacterized protein n=1 Tax=Ixodes scapularis TaxID=6945 RepID=B7QEU2_IXOSC|nr:hypothetical protein IscW_ISCW022821 [Ixodes scapularis]|eukprot:XP_002414056.1 hypothetical protein IscW_ISCW022821 [Ixodes scapularis]